MAALAIHKPTPRPSAAVMRSTVAQSLSVMTVLARHIAVAQREAAVAAFSVSREPGVHQPP